MIDITDKTKCCGCYGCYNICPKNAITMKEDEKGFKYPIVDKEKCIQCGLCKKICPILNKKQVQSFQKAYACYNKDEEVRMNSSSGGIFSLLAEYILNNNGVIYGASFNSQWQVEHIRIDKKEDLVKLRTSKYVQSSINETYKLAKEDLENGVKVLFTGTPCQVNGLFRYLQKEYENLYTQDIICHGVPSPKVWKKYLEYRKKEDNESPLQINHRNKEEGWEKWALELLYTNSKYKMNKDNDLFIQAFLRDAILRDSCYKCSFKDKNRESDITLADFWGINKILPKMNDGKGISLVIVNTRKGEKIFNELHKKMIWKETNFEQSIQHNPSMIMSVNKPQYSDEFFINLDSLEFDELVDKYTIKPKKTSFVRRCIRKCKKIIKTVYAGLK